VDPIEEAFSSISGVDWAKTQASATDGLAQFTVFFDFEKDIQQASQDIRDAISTQRADLPTEMEEPVLTRFDPSQQSVLSLALSSSEIPPATLTRIADPMIVRDLRTVPGVAQVSVVGGLERELTVEIRPADMQAAGISVAQVVQALEAQNLAAPVGRLNGALDERAIRLKGRLDTPEDFARLVLAQREGRIIRLGQVATVRDGTEEQRDQALFNGRDAVGIEVLKAKGYSTTQVTDLIHRHVVALQKRMPPGAKLEIVQDAGTRVHHAVTNVQEALIEGALLTVLVVFLFLNSWRSTVITGLALPVSVLASFIAVWAFGFTLNTMSLMGLSLAIGILIDDAIVVRENIVRHMERGADRVTAAREGTAEIGLAVTATTFSIVAVFVPVAFMGGGAGEWFRPFAVTVAASVLVSLLVSFTLDPMLSAYWADPPGYRQRKRRGLGRILQRFNSWFDHQADRYGTGIAWALHHRRWMAAISVLALVGALVLQGAAGGSEFLPKADYGTIAVEIRTPSSTSLEYARDKLQQAAALARTLPETTSTDSNVNAGGGRVYVNFADKNERSRSSFELASELRVLLRRLVGAEYVVLDDLNNGARKPVQIQFYGEDSRRLMEITNEFMARVREIPGAVDVGLSEQDPKDELRIELKRGLANQLGISMADAAQTLRVAFAGVEVGDWVDPVGEARDVAVRLHPDDRVNSRNIEQLPVAVAGTSMLVPLEQIATITLDKGPARIQHLDGKRTVTVSANAEGRSSGEVTADAMKLARRITFPEGYGLSLGGASRDQEELFGEMLTALFLGIGVMYLVLVMQFGSFTAPVPVMLSLPLSLIGVVLALLATGGTLNLMSFIGVIMLMGLVAKNAILLLDCARKEEATGVNREEALMHAGRLRLRPILMTTFALVAGMTPVAIGLGEGGEFYRPMAVAIIGGVITSTVLTLLVIPSFYDSVEIARERAVLKARARAALMNPAMAFVITLVEALLALTLLRALYRAVRWLFRRPPAEHPVDRAARLTGFEVPAGFEAHRSRRRQRRTVSVVPGSVPTGTDAGVA
jgi:hydrophobe/amphiphile efflux-1 (HAE1) family protein